MVFNFPILDFDSLYKTPQEFSLPNKIINEVKLQKFRFPVPDFEKLSRETPPQEFSLPVEYNMFKRKTLLSNGDPSSLFFDENSGVRRKHENTAFIFNQYDFL
ncbi:10536_t:CDS:2 [Ambispora gerdemannii]|uniref:10536_t:CDS:1 n=1 Tax=Ambispora gerdemannii TaxID=144530 RepID=A0A9N9EZ29_9GLOM|nr:10536_t:CDS:2 [Ambispora gerdemannii]